MVMVPNPDYHRDGDFALVDGRLSLAARAATHLRQHRAVPKRAVRRAAARRKDQDPAAVPRLDRPRLGQRRTTTAAGPMSARPTNSCASIDSWRIRREKSPAMNTTTDHRSIRCSTSRDCRALRNHARACCARDRPLLTDARATIEGVAEASDTPDWDTFVQPLAAAQGRLDRAWRQVAHLNAVVDIPALRKSMPY